jgi:hypothetical protein
LKELLSVFFRAPICGFFGVVSLPLTVAGLAATKLYFRRRRTQRRDREE